VKEVVLTAAPLSVAADSSAKVLANSTQFALKNLRRFSNGIDRDGNRFPGCLDEQAGSTFAPTNQPGRNDSFVIDPCCPEGAIGQMVFEELEGEPVRPHAAGKSKSRRAPGEQQA
jgi:hypothetical protein